MMIVHDVSNFSNNMYVFVFSGVVLPLLAFARQQQFYHPDIQPSYSRQTPYREASLIPEPTFGIGHGRPFAKEDDGYRRQWPSSFPDGFFSGDGPRHRGREKARPGSGESGGDEDRRPEFLKNSDQKHSRGREPLRSTSEESRASNEENRSPRVVSHPFLHERKGLQFSSEENIPRSEHSSNSPASEAEEKAYEKKRRIPFPEEKKEDLKLTPARFSSNSKENENQIVESDKSRTGTKLVGVNMQMVAGFYPRKSVQDDRRELPGRFTPTSEAEKTKAQKEDAKLSGVLMSLKKGNPNIPSDSMEETQNTKVAERRESRSEKNAELEKGHGRERPFPASQFPDFNGFRPFQSVFPSGGFGGFGSAEGSPWNRPRSPANRPPWDVDGSNEDRRAPNRRDPHERNEKQKNKPLSESFPEEVTPSGEDERKSLEAAEKPAEIKSKQSFPMPESLQDRQKKDNDRIKTSYSKSQVSSNPLTSATATNAEASNSTSPTKGPSEENIILPTEPLKSSPLI
ncbi:unnamed protein product [Caenorhabditis auriculariae]|uniref:Uncharacterized protein n=1 Tax=Caenorhabditis auriculariae TaxID=2777116 RepID=A0A8S1HMG7_9PELO|nr:unnamed protein product [Caenorhabditis auriculariae]